MVGQTLAHYRVISKLGEGGMGVVYKAQDLRLGRLVALKTLSAELAGNPEALERFEREARAASALNHPHICTIYGIESHEARPFLVMELVEGQTLRERIAVQRPAIPEVIGWAIQAADALAAAHAKGIVHRDIKCANLMLTPSGHLKVMDFGLAKQVAGQRQPPSINSSTLTLVPPDTLTGLRTAVGTVGYMSPEQARGESLDARTDLFSLGVALYELATGQLPFSGQTAAVVFDALLNKSPAAPHALNPGVPPELSRIILKLLEKDRDFRYHSAEELHTDLRRLERDSVSGMAPAAGSRRRRVRWWAPAGVLAALLLLSIAAWRLEWFSYGREAPVRDLSPRQLTANPPGNFVPRLAISPDGNYLAYSDLYGIYLRAIGGGETRKLPVPESMCFR